MSIEALQRAVSAGFHGHTSPGTSKVRLFRYPSNTDTTLEDAFFKAHLKEASEDAGQDGREQDIEREIESVYEEIRLHSISKSTASSESTSIGRQLRRIAALQAELGHRKQAIATLRDSMTHEDEAHNFTEERAATLGMLGELYEEVGCLFGEERPSKRILLLRRSKEFYHKQLGVLELLKGSQSYEGALCWYNVGRVHKMLHEPKWTEDFDTAIRIILDRGVEEFPSHVIDTLTEYNRSALANYKASPAGLQKPDRLQDAAASNEPRRSVGPHYGGGNRIGRPAGDESLPSSSASSSSEDNGVVMPVLGRIRLKDGHHGAGIGDSAAGSGARVGSSKARPKVKVVSASSRSHQLAARKGLDADCTQLRSDCADICP